ncbi:hypothetical protein GCM10007416_23310 [Kroppenstedtia guangzhouensis]|uniref:Bacteriocin (Lactococcin_972) n=2 Tax=Kroppenstedtia guangzhouensis TaxID=1274356 RepID=A0ABQ1GSH9_9BACL|nr:hypothetical protein GCM10007416_23310 [Kroppenstedtia guangzhouensis]
MAGSIIKKVSGVTMSLALALTFASVSSANAASGSVDLTDVKSLKSGAVTPFSVNVGGGTWDYGTRLVSFGTKKEVYSNYYHGTKNHGSTAQIGTQSNKSCVRPGSTSYASARGGLFDSTHAYWNTSCTP